METNPEQGKQVNVVEEYVLLDLDDVSDIPANSPYVFLGLDTLNPILVIGNCLKLIGEYQETIGTCYVFSERDEESVVMHAETGPSDRDLFKGTCIVAANSAACKKVEPIASLQRILKFRLASEDELKKMPQVSAASF